MPVYTYGKKLLDANGNVVLPCTKAKFVYMSNNLTAEDLLGLYANIQGKIVTSTNFFDIKNDHKTIDGVENCYLGQTLGIALRDIDQALKGRG